MNNSEEYWEYLFHLAEIMQIEEKYQDENESASFCEAKVHLSGSESPLGDLGEDLLHIDKKEKEL